MEWNNTRDILPSKWEYVLVEIDFCSYPACVSLYNGFNFVSVTDKTTIYNVEFWSKLNLRK